MNHFIRLLKTFDYHSLSAYAESLAPSSRYGSMPVLMGISIVGVGVDKIFGMDDLAFILLALVFVVELISGICAAIVRKETIKSVKLSRFSLKVACYFIMISFTYLMAESFHNHHKEIAYWVFDWLNVFLVMHIALENIVSILENLAVIDGKDKSAWISKIQEKFNALIG